MHTTLNVTGRPAQFGRGVMADVSAKLIGVFATNLAGMLAATNDLATEPAAREPAVTATARTGEPAAAPASATPTAAPAPSEDSLDLLKVAALPVLKRIEAPAGALLAALAVVLIWRRRRHR